MTLLRDLKLKAKEIDQEPKTIQEPVIQTRSQKRKLETVSTRVTRSKKD